MGQKGELIPLRNNAAGEGSGLKVLMYNMSDEFFPNDERRRGYNVSIIRIHAAVVGQNLGLLQKCPHPCTYKKTGLFYNSIFSRHC